MATTRFLTTGIVAGLAAAMVSCSSPEAPPASWREQVLQARAAREAELTKEDGWLSVAGLFFLEEGRSQVGSSPDSPIRLPEGTPAVAGQVAYDGARVVFEPAPGVEAALVGGDVVEAFQPLVSAVREVVYSRSTALATRSLRIERSALGPAAGIAGCAFMVLDHVLSAEAVDAPV